MYMPEPVLSVLGGGFYGIPTAGHRLCWLIDSKCACPEDEGGRQRLFHQWFRFGARMSLAELSHVLYG